MIGSAVGGALVAVVGPGLGIEIAAASFFVAAVLVASMRLPAVQRDRASSDLTPDAVYAGGIMSNCAA
ncbi:MAG: hypothetical protein ACYDC5_13275 [Candidatus Dormibacteria bacterium]